jgi:hypothetical protein
MANINNPSGDEQGNPEEDIQPSGINSGYVKSWKTLEDRISGLDDSQELLIHSASGQGPGSRDHRMTVGELRSKVGEAMAKHNSAIIYYEKDDQEFMIDFEDDYCSIELMTPEKRAEYEKKIKLLKQIKDLSELGVSRRLFYGNSEDDWHPAYTPEEIVGFSKIIEKYLREKEGGK